jgi:hypothetical protein
MGYRREPRPVFARPPNLTIEERRIVDLMTVRRGMPKVTPLSDPAAELSPS